MSVLELQIKFTFSSFELPDTDLGIEYEGGIGTIYNGKVMITGIKQNGIAHSHSKGQWY